MKGCKNCPAYAKCTVIYRGSACAALRGTYGIDSDPEIITNADRIRSMSDEELAERIWPKFGCPEGKNHVTCGYVGECKDCWIGWLQQPEEEDC